MQKTLRMKCMNEEIVKTVYTILKQYLPQKDMQQACDHLVDDLQEVLDEEELYRLAGLDKYMNPKRTSITKMKTIESMV